MATKNKKNSKAITEYIKSHPPFIQKRLREIRAIIKKNAPQAEEKLSYGMPYYSLKGRLLYFAAFKNHIGFYPMKSGVKAFQKELENYVIRPGTIQFSHDQKLPKTLLQKIVRFRVGENLNS